MWMYLTLPNCTLKIVKIVKFGLRVFYHHFFFKEGDLHKTSKVLSSGSSGVTSLLLMTGLFENKRNICASTALRLDDIKREDFCADWQTWTVLFPTSKNLYVTMVGAPRADSRWPCNPRHPLNLASSFPLKQQAFNTLTASTERSRKGAIKSHYRTRIGESEFFSHSLESRRAAKAASRCIRSKKEKEKVCEGGPSRLLGAHDTQALTLMEASGAGCRNKKEQNSLQDTKPFTRKTHRIGGWRWRPC